MADGDSGVLGDIAEAAGGVVGAIGGELKKFGKSATGQVTGVQPRDDDLAAMQQGDKEFSEQGQAQVRARIQAAYQEYAAKQKRAQMQGEQQEKAQEEQQKEVIQIQKKEEQNSAIQKTRAEVKNYGAE